MKTITDKYGIDHIITVTNKDNERQVESMVEKAMRAYAKCLACQREGWPMVAQTSEYEATVCCIEMFVDQPNTYICEYINARAKQEFGI